MWGLTLNQWDIYTEQALNRIQKSGLKLNTDKCVFAATELILLGHIIPGKGVYPDPEKVRAIKDMHFSRSK